LKEFGVSPYTLSLLKLQAHFSAFHLKEPEKAKTILKNALDMPLNNINWQMSKWIWQIFYCLKKNSTKP
jgi:hypothetical protein